MGVADPALTPVGRDTPMTPMVTPDSPVDSAAPELNSGGPAIPPSNLRRLLLASHSRGAMLLCIGGHVALQSPPPEPQALTVTGTRAHLFGAPLPRSSQ